MKGGKISGIFNSILLDLKNVKGVKMLELAGRDGFPIGDSRSNDSETLTLMSAAILKAAENITSKLGNGHPNHVIVDYDGGKIIAVNAGQKALISVLAAKDAALEPILSELERTAGKIKEII
ncbi:MAG: roadblock/LC7 domain-containing protein [Candidatus Methanoperedenaceae archaeon]|nr:roadblock/LC7 domain-containing protein [Candidatus Methanoperedenaceae archaeon]